MNSKVAGRRMPWLQALASLCLLALLLSCQPRSTELDASAVPADVPFGEGRLWEIAKKGLEPSYVFATIQFVDARLCDLPVAVWQALGASTRAAFEFVPTPEDEALAAEASRLQPGHRLEDILGGQLFGRAAEISLDYGLDGNALQPMQPWLLAELLSVSPAEAVRLSLGAVSLDSWLQQVVRRQGKAPIALRGIKEYTDYYAGMSEGDQVALVRDQVAAFGLLDAWARRGVALYLKGDLASLRVEATDLSYSSDLEAAGRFRRWLIEDRSKLMSERMVPHIESGAVFFAVSAYLLPSEDGILSLLQRRGYTVTRLE